MQLGDDVAAHLRGRRRRVGVHGDAREGRAQHAELPVLRAKVVAPLADAVRLVHREESRVRTREALCEALHHQALRRHVEQMVPARVEAGEDLRALPARLAAVEKSGRHARLAQAVHLVLHERDQRRDDDGEAAQVRGGRLVAERFAAARGQHHERVASLENGADGLGLQRKEAVVAPDAPYGLVDELRLDDAAIIADGSPPASTSKIADARVTASPHPRSVYSEGMEGSKTPTRLSDANCSPVVERQVREHGGSICYGWRLWEWPNVMLEGVRKPG